jgi:NADH:ubiquinone oxidoreductase subunit E
VELQASFCLGFCSQAVSLKIDGFQNSENDQDSIVLHDVNKDNVEELFVNHVYSLLNL